VARQSAGAGLDQDGIVKGLDLDAETVASTKRYDRGDITVVAQDELSHRRYRKDDTAGRGGNQIRWRTPARA
jgi:hypothetical protein